MSVENQTTEQQPANSPAPTSDERLASAVGGYKNQAASDFGGVPNIPQNIHEVAYPDAPVERPEVVATEEFDTRAFEREFGLPEGHLDGCPSQREAEQFLNEFYSGDVANSYTQAVDQVRWAEGALEVNRRAEAYFDSLNVHQFGHSEKEVTPAQRAEREKHNHVAGALVAAFARSGADRVPTIEQVLNLARIKLDKSYKPTFVKPKEYSNIHAALADMPR